MKLLPILAAMVVSIEWSGVASAQAATPAKIGKVCHRWNYQAHACAETTDVLSDRPDVAFYVSKLAVDADGSPRAYHPGDTGAYDYLANIAVSSLFGIQGQGSVGPAPDFYVSGTSLSDPRYPSTRDTRHRVDAGLIPYFVSPASLPVPPGRAFKLGALGFVIDLKTGGWSGAIYADSGHAVGEGSIALAKGLGLDPFSKRHPPKVVGFDGKQFLYMVFPDVRIAPPWTEAAIRTQARAKFDAWGGEARLRALYPNCPPLKTGAP
jgi:hypothetical protein